MCLDGWEVVKVSDLSVSKFRKTRHLPPSEKYELWVSVLTGQATQREAAEKYKVDRSTLVAVCKTAKQTGSTRHPKQREQQSICPS